MRIHLSGFIHPFIYLFISSSYIPQFIYLSFIIYPQRLSICIDKSVDKRIDIFFFFILQIDLERFTVYRFITHSCYAQSNHKFGGAALFHSEMKRMQPISFWWNGIETGAEDTYPSIDRRIENSTTCLVSGGFFPLPSE